MSNNQKKLIPSIVCAVIFGVATVVFIILGAIEKDADRSLLFYIFAIICGVGALILVLFAILMNIKFKKQSRNFSNPNSIAYKVMGPGTKFTYFAVIPDADSQAARNATVNALGAVSAVVFGFGSFTWGKDSLDAFVSEDEFIIGSKYNGNFDDSKFTCYHATDIDSITFSTVKKYERLTMTFTNNRGGLVLDIDTSQYPAELVRSSFAKLLATKIRLNNERQGNASPDSVRQTPTDVFDGFPNDSK